MTSSYRRLTLNTTLKDAGLFDDDPWESENDISYKIKKEPIEDEHSNSGWTIDNTPATSVNEELRNPPKGHSRRPLEDDNLEARVESQENRNQREDPWVSDLNTAYKIKKEPIEEEQSKLDWTIDNTPSTSFKEEPGDRIVKTEPNDDYRIRNSSPKNIKKIYIKQEQHHVDTDRPRSNRQISLKRKSDVLTQQGHAPSASKKRLPSSTSPELKKFKTEDDTIKRKDRESDPEVLRRRQKQIDYGKNTIGYDRYLQITPRYNRSREDARTPDKFRKYSRRAWDGLIKQWRLKLHKYDPVEDL